MSSREADLLGREWTTLQRDCESYERSALWIKLAAPLLYVATLALNIDAFTTGVLIAALWVQEAILRTGQSRLAARLLRIEAWLRELEPATGSACQLYSEWEAMRPGAAALLSEYLANALRPTVAFPYVVLLVLLISLALT